MVCGLRTSTLADRDAQIFRGTDDWNRLRTGPPRIKTTVTVQYSSYGRGQYADS